MWTSLKINRGFTIVEVIVSVLIISIIGASAYMSYITVNSSNESTRNLSMAVSLTQRSLESVRAQAQINFDNLSTGNMQAIFDQETDIQTQFPGFSRQVIITPLLQSTELKKVDLNVSWTEKGRLREYKNVLLISRPSEPLPGNITGEVTELSTLNKIANVNVRVTYDDPGASLPSGPSAALEESTLSFTTQTDANGYYTFKDRETNSFILKPGNWILTAKHPNYYDYTYMDKDNPTPIMVNSNEERNNINFSMQPKPVSAHITGSTFATQFVSLYEGGRFVAIAGNPQKGNFDFTITFENTDARSFTLITSNQDYPHDPKNVNINIEKTYPYLSNRHCGNIPDNQGWGKSYNYKGWSSAVVRGSVVDDPEGGLTVTYTDIEPNNPWGGSENTDWLRVSPGDTLNLKAIPLGALPTATLEASVVDSEGKAVESTTAVYTYWHLGYSSEDYRWYIDIAGKGGKHTITVPAEQSLFPDENTYYLWARGFGIVPGGCCCQPQPAYSEWQRVGPFTEGVVLPWVFRLNAASAQKCGDAKGRVLDARNLAGVGSATINIAGRLMATDTSGYFEYLCSSSGSCSELGRIATGKYNVIATKSGFYRFDSVGNGWYEKRHKPPDIDNGSIHIKEENKGRDKAAELDNPPVYFLSIGRRDIEGKVVVDLGDGSSSAAIGVTVELSLYWDEIENKAVKKTCVTDTQGKYRFEDVLESWPPPVATAELKPYFKQDARRHNLRAVLDGNPEYEATPQSEKKDIELIVADDETPYDPGDLIVAPKGAF